MTSSTDFILLLHLINSSDRVEGRKRLQKMVCIAKNQDKVPFTFNFKPYFYGPYSEDLSDTVDSLRGAGLIEEERINITDSVSQYQYFLTDKGREAIRNSNYELHIAIDKLLSSIRKMNLLETNELVRIAKNLQFD